jgi:asparagine synthase (glutamine-hydrolysing)
MCGIVGVLAPGAVDPSLVATMRDRLTHRGPDAAGIWSSPDGRVCLGHRRLTIIDPSPASNQPFVSEEGRLAIVLNGEIYNHRDLGRQLEGEGVVFRTRSDTEVLLEAYRRWEEECLERLSGMFAFAIWDSAYRRLFCARDRAGEKPFHYASASGSGSFAFASELKALLPWSGLGREIDWTSVADFLTFGFVPDPKTVWQDARKLAPASFLVVDCRGDGAVAGEQVPYWDFELAPEECPPAEWQSRVRETLERSAAEMTVSDVAVGTFLSGGVDSSSVTAALARAGEPLAAYTVGFAEQEFDERGWASRVAARYGVEHVEREVSAADVESVFRDVVLWHYDEPFNDYSYLPTYYVCREARNAITVALSGDGGDEIFAGYRKYSMLTRRASIDGGIPRPVAQLVAVGAHGMLPSRTEVGGRLHRYRLSPDELVLSTLVTGVPTDVLRRVSRGPLAQALRVYDPLDSVRHHVRRVPPAEHGLVDAMRYVDFKTTLGSGILTKVDRASMAVSLEVRPVYLHRAMLDLARRIPGRLLATPREAKTLLKGAFAEWLPAEILHRPKQGFAMPLGEWLRGGFDLGNADDGSRRADGLFDPAYVDAVRAEHAAGLDRTAVLHGITFLDRWLERWA